MKRDIPKFLYIFFRFPLAFTQLASEQLELLLAPIPNDVASNP